MRKFRHMMKMAALVLTGAIISACSGEDNAVDHPANGARTYTVTTTLTIDGGAETRALDGSTGAKTFAPGDKIAVKYYKTGRDWAYETTISNELKSTDITEDGKKASFTVTLDNPDPGKTEVRYVYPAYMESDEGRAHILESEQNGTLASLTTKFDYAEASGTIVHSGGDITLPTGLTLSNQLALAKFTFSDGTSDITASLKRLIIEDGTHTYLVTPKGTSDIWVAMYPVTTAQTITLTATDDAQYYEKSVTGKTLAKNNLYPISVTMPAATSDRTVPLTLEAKENDVVVKFKLSSFLTNPVEYRTYASGTWSAWAEYTSEDEITLATTGDKVNFRGTNSNYCDHSHEASTIFCTDDCYLYGNMMSLVDATAFPVLKKLTEDHTFHNLFSGNEHVYSHDTRPILLPATKLRDCCYQGLFEGCSNLTVAPELPATELAGNCYEAMFNGCSSLEHGPLLPATELAGHCYDAMFQGCSNLKSVICLATEYLDNTYWMLKGAGKKDDPKPILYIAPGAVWTIDDVGDCEDGEDGIPNYWIVKDYNAHSLNISNPDVGQIIGNDGRNYDYASKPSGVIAVAKICDVNGEHGLALALTDEGQMNWSSAKAACEAHTPAFTNGTWKLATHDEWDYIIYTINDVFRDGFSSIGGTNMQSDVYWSSTETPSNTDFVDCWDFNSSGGWNPVDKNANFYARACLAW